MRIIEYSPTKRFGLNEYDEIVDIAKDYNFVISIHNDFKYIHDRKMHSILSGDDINTQEDILWIRSKIKTDLYYRVGYWGEKTKYYFLASKEYVTLCQSSRKV